MEAFFVFKAIGYNGLSMQYHDHTNERQYEPQSDKAENK